MFKLLSIIILIVSFSSSVLADEITHQLGNSGYAVRWAMDKGAAEKSPVHYWNAVYFQKEARAKFAKRYMKEAMELSKKAESEAKLALKDCNQ